MDIDFKADKWLHEFHIASRNKYGFRELRADIFQGTVQIIKHGGYKLNGDWIAVDNGDKVREKTVFYEKPAQLSPAQNELETKVNIIEADCIETALLLQSMGLKTCVLNMANAVNPGGGVLQGAGAQEENIFRRTNLLSSLYQFVDYSDEYNIPRNSENSYPLATTGGIYSGNITVFRSSETSGYGLLSEPKKLSFTTVAAISYPEVKKIKGQYFIAGRHVEKTKEKMRSILRIGKTEDNDALVLSAFGCGAFRNPPEHVAQLFHEVFKEEEFKNQYKLIVFSIIDDHNAKKAHNPRGNLIPFIEEFN